MIKKILTGVCTLLILESSFPAPTIFAETIDPLTDTEATMPTITDEPTVAAQSIINNDSSADNPATEAGSSSSSESKGQGTTNTTSSTNKAAKEATTKATSDSDKKVADSEVEAQSDSETDEVATGDISAELRAKAARIHNIDPSAVNDETPMVEGTFGEDDPETYLLDDTLSNALRISGINAAIGGVPWNGDQKEPGKLTIGDMKSLEMAIISNGGGVYNSPKVRDLTGLEYAFNLVDLSCAQNDLIALDLTKNPKLTLLVCDRNQISDISLYDQGSQVNSLLCFENKIKDFTGIIKATSISAYRQEVTIPLSDVKVEAEKQQKSIDSIIISPTIPLTKATYVSNDGLQSIEGTIEGNSIKFKNMSKQKLSEGSISYESDSAYNGSNDFTMMECVLTFEEYNPQLLSEGDNSLEYSIDRNLSTALRAQSGWDGYRKNAGELTVDDMATLSKASANALNLDSLNGLQYATNLIELSSNGSKLSSLEPIKDLPIVKLSLDNTQLTSLEYLENLPLVDLNCSDNQLTSLEPIKDLPIEVLDFSNNKVSDVSCLFTSKTLNRVDGSYNCVSDISGFSGLEALYMNHQFITIPVETWNALEDDKLILNKLKTTGEADKISSVTTGYEPSGTTLSWEGDQITFSGYSRRDLSDALFDFEYDSTKLTGAETVQFSGSLKFEDDQNIYLTELEGGGINPQLAEVLRTEKAATNDGGPWSGYGKPKDNLTVADMENLTSVDVSGKELTSLFGMYYAKNLTKLKANNNQITSLRNLYAPMLTTLEEINVDDNHLTSLEFGYFTGSFSIKRISANNNHLTNLDSLTDMTTLEEISVDDNEIGDLYVLGSNSSMKRISAKNNKIRDYSAVEGFQDLEKADLQGQKWQENSYPYFLANVENNSLVDYSTAFPVFGSMPHTMFTFSVERSDKSKDPDAICTIFSNFTGVQINAPRRSILNNGSTLHFDLDPDSVEADITYNGNISFPEYTGTVLRETEGEPNYSETIDPKFAKLLRENSDLTNGGEAWSGDGKQENRLTDIDMEALTSVDVSDSDLTSLKGIEFAMFLKNLKANNNDIEEVDLIGNKELETLELNHNSLTTIDLTNQTKLTSLDCGSNQMTNSQIFSGLTSLTTLKIGGNSFDNFNGISGLTGLTTLAVNDSKLSDLSDFSSLSGLTNLKSLDISNNQLSDISKVSDLKNLTTLNADKNQIKDITSIDQMSNLIEATIDDQSLQPSYPRFWKDGDQFKATIDYLKMNVSNGVTFTADIDNASGVSVKTDANTIIATSGSKVNLEGQTISFKRTGKGISFSGTLEYSEATLSEGLPNDGSNGDYDIDADFSEAIRKGTSYIVTSDLTLWSGREKEANTLTREDMEAIIELAVNDLGLNSVKGINFAKNLEHYNGDNNNLTNLDDFSENSKLTGIYAHNNKIADITGIPFKDGRLGVGTQRINMDFPDFKRQSDGTYKATIDLLKIPNMSSSPWTNEQYILIDRNTDNPVTASKEAGSNKLVLTSATFPKLDQVYLEFVWQGPNRLFAGIINIESEEFLKEGSPGDTEPYDIDATLAQALRSDETEVTTVSGDPWSGKNKPIDRISKRDMADILSIKAVNQNLASLYGIEHATNLQTINVNQNKLTSLNELKSNAELTAIDANENQINDISVIGGLTKLTTVNAKDQALMVDYLTFTADGANYKTTVDHLKMPTGYSVESAKIVDETQNKKATIKPNGATIDVTGPTRSILNGHQLNFSVTQPLKPAVSFNGNISFAAYAGTGLIEGTSGAYNLHTNFASRLRGGAGTISGGGTWSGLNKPRNQITDLDMEELIGISVSPTGLTSMKGIEYATNITSLNAYYNSLTDVNLTKNVKLTTLNLERNPLISLDVTQNTALTTLNISDNRNTTDNKLDSIDLSKNTELITFSGQTNSGLKTVVFSNENTKLTTVNLGNTALTEIDLSMLPVLADLNVYNCSNLEKITFGTENTEAMRTLNGSNNPKISEIEGINLLTNLTALRIYNNQISDISPLSSLTNLTTLNIAQNQISDISSLSGMTNLTTLSSNDNQISEVDSLSGMTKLTILDISNNQVKDISNLNGLTELTLINVRNNKIGDISSLKNKPNLTNLNASNQQIQVDIPRFDLSKGTGIVDVLTTTNGAGLTANLVASDLEGATVTNTADSDDITIGGVAARDFAGQSITFEYAGASLGEGATTEGTKTFNGTITFNEYTGRKLIEGVPDASGTEDYDLNKTFADQLRNNSSTWTTSTNLWSGTNKETNQITDLDMEELIEIRVNGGGTGSRRGNLTSIKGVDYAQNITSLMANYNRIKKVDLTKNNELTVLEIYQNYLEEIDVTKNTELTNFLVSNNELTGINIDENKSLTHFNAHGNSEIKSINFKNNTLLKDTNISLTSIEKVDVAGLRNLTTLRIYGSSTAPSKLTEVEVDGNNTALITLQINNNQVSDISNLDVLTNLTTLNASNQTLTTSTPSVDGTKKAEVDLLKTTAGSTLTTSRNGTNLITPEAEYGSDGDKAVLSNVTRSSLSGKSYNFSYSNLQEGATSGTKSFNGTVTFDKASDTNQTLEADKTKAEIGETVGFSWNVYSIGDIDMKDVQAKLDLPEGLAVDAESIKITNGTAISPPANFDNEISIGDIVKGASATITFNATVQDTEVLKWLTTTGTVTWADTTGDVTRFTSTATTKIQVKDDQQSYTPSNEGLAITSVPAGFNFGYRSRLDREALYPLRESDYQSNTKVPQNGFYVRVQNNQSTNSGWSLSASLSNFSNQEGIMPFTNGTSLNFSNMSIKNVLQPDTEDEIFNDSPTGIPSTVATAELASGGSSQKLISAEQTQGSGTWQLQIPFNGVELQLPPNAGKTGEKYNATVSWSLDNTP